MCLVEVLEKYLLGDISYEDAKGMIYAGDTYKQSYVSPAQRFLMCYEKGLVIEAIPHLRQVLLYEKKPISLNEKYYECVKNSIFHEDLFFDDANLSVNAKPWAIVDEEDLKYSYTFEQKRSFTPSFPDGDLISKFGYESYINLQQKLMIHTLKKLQPGECYLACLPTGNGKSLLWQYAVASGKFEGLTVVVVPTVGLIADHVKSDRIVFKNMPWINSIAYSAKANEESEGYINVLFEKINKAKQTILYISPESLLNSGIVKALISVAAHGKLSAIVVDEAHLIIDWGMNFRPEFQYIPTICKNLNQYDRKIYTILTSATITSYDVNVLKIIFGEERFVEYRGDALRPEIQFYSHYCKREDERKRNLLQLIHSVPRPAIIYVGTKKQSEEYKHLIERMGISRVEQFTGDTTDTERDRLIDKWRNDEIDFMVATSAFGMGVDKPDVRTIITAYTPESISRFYQEVGRSGRDGYSALSFILYCPEHDKGVLSTFIDKQLLRSVSIVDRWNDIVKQASVDIDEPDCLLIKTSIAPAHLKYSKTGEKNSDWNQNVLLFMIRCGLIEMVDVRRSYKDGYKSYSIKIRLLKPALSDMELNKTVDFVRNEERSILTDGRDLVQNMLSTDNDKCFSLYFKDAFEHVELGCAGCPSCRKNGLYSYFPECSSKLIIHRNITPGIVFNYASTCSTYMSMHTKGMFFYEDRLKEKDEVALIVHLITAGADIIVNDHVDNEVKFSIAMMEKSDYLLLTYDELELLPKEYLIGNVVLFLEQGRESKVIKRVDRRFRLDECNIIYICEKDYYSVKEQHYFRDVLEYAVPISSIISEGYIC